MQFVQVSCAPFPSQTHRSCEVLTSQNHLGQSQIVWSTSEAARRLSSRSRGHRFRSMTEAARRLSSRSGGHGHPTSKPPFSPYTVAWFVTRLLKHTTEVRSPTAEDRRCGAEIDPAVADPGVLLPDSVTSPVAKFVERSTSLSTRTASESNCRYRRGRSLCQEIVFTGPGVPSLPVSRLLESNRQFCPCPLCPFPLIDLASTGVQLPVHSSTIGDTFDQPLTFFSPLKKRL